MEGKDEIGVHAYFTGMVQGVFFRASTQRKARSLGLRGWVRNLPDGRVEAWIEGDRTDIGRLVAFCQGEIPAARVDLVDFEEGGTTGDYADFEIVR